MSTFGTSTDSMGNVGVTDEAAIIAELNARLEAFGGLGAYRKRYPNDDARNFDKYLKGKKFPSTPILLRYLRRLGVDYADFFGSVDERTRGGSEPVEQFDD